MRLDIDKWIKGKKGEIYKERWRVLLKVNFRGFTVMMHIKDVIALRNTVNKMFVPLKHRDLEKIYKLK